VVITFADITVAKTLEAKLRGQHASLEKSLAEKSAVQSKADQLAPSDATTGKRTNGDGNARRSFKP
jgi:hypothetical protein